MSESIFLEKTPLSMQNETVFETFRQHATYEVFAQNWHPLLPILGTTSKYWKQRCKNHWRNKLGAPERIDICSMYWPLKRDPLFQDKTVGNFAFLHRLFQDYTDGRFESDKNLDALLTCVLYEWPATARIVSNYCDLTRDREKLNEIGNCAFLIATGKRSFELVELTCQLFAISKELALPVISQMCAYGYKGIAYFLCDLYSVTVADLRIKDNYAIYHSIRNDKFDVIKWLLESYEFTVEEVNKCLTSRSFYSSIDVFAGTKTMDFVNSWIEKQENSKNKK